MKFITEELSQNPTFNTVVGLTNTTFDPENYVANRGATEGQIKIVHDMIKALQDWLDEFGCSDDPYDQLRTKVDQIEARIEECCQNQADTILDELRAKLNDLETRIENCCENPPSGTCTGNVITVSFGWNGTNPYQDGGKATAVSADPNVQIAGFHFLVSAGPGTYVKKSTSGRWSIDGNGNVVCSFPDGAGGHLVSAIVATDTNGCEGMTPVSLPQSNVTP